MSVGTARLTIPHARIRRIVDWMPARYTERDVRANIRLRCDSLAWTVDLIAQAEEYAVRYFREMVGR